MKKIYLIFISLVLFLVGCESNTSGSDNYTEPIQQQGETYWWNETVFYEIFVRSFYDSDGDGIGDLQGIIEKLDYLNDNDSRTDFDLGITGIWLMPVCQSPSYHGYDVIDYCQIEEDYGTNEDFLQLINEWHARGIKVIVDYVMNHSSNQHPWFIASANNEPDYANWYCWRSDDPGYTQPWGGNYHVWHQHSNGQYYYGVFWGGMPDLNYEEPAVKDEMFDIASFWLQDMMVDGFRCDAVKYIIEDNGNLENTEETYQFWEEFHSYYKGVNPDAMAVGEAWDETSVILNYIDGKFDFCFEFNLAIDILYSVKVSSPHSVRSNMSEIKELYPFHQYGTFLTNHDQNRVFDELDNDVDKAKLAAAIYLTLPGIPYLYYGEEIGMNGQKPDEDIRRPMQWSSGTNAGFTTGTPWHQINNNYTIYNVEDEQNDENSLWHWYRTLIQIRNEHLALTRGTYQAINTSNGNIYAFLRQFQDEIVLIISNFSGSNKTDIILSADFTNIEPGNYSITNLLYEENMGSVTIGEEGSISDWIPINTLEGRKTYLLKLENLIKK